MTEQTFVSAGFEMNVMHPEDSGCASTFYYYTLEIGDICLITNASDEADSEGWWCSIFDSETLKIRGEGDLLELIKVLRLNTNE